MQPTILTLFLACLPAFLWAQVPAPDAFYTFDEASGTTVADSSANGYDARWYNIFDEDPGSPVTSTAGWRPGEGYRNGAAYFAGDHALCPQDCPDPAGGDCSCSSGSDLILFSEDGDGDCDDGFVDPDANAFFHDQLTAFTVAFWFKNDWDYLNCPVGERRTCHKDSTNCAWERQVLFTMGDDNGITIAIEPGATVPSLIRVTANGTGGSLSQAVDTDTAFWYSYAWRHIAVTFAGDGASSGSLKLFINGVERRNITTNFGSMTVGDNSAVFGGEHDRSVSGFNVSACWPNEDYLLCGITAEFYNTLRYGWPARGWLDELAYWKNTALTAEELTTFADIGNTGTSTSISSTQALAFSLVPTRNDGRFRVQGLPATGRYAGRIFNHLGQPVLDLPSVSDGNVITLSGASVGLYYLQIWENGRPAGVQKFVIMK